MGEFGAVKLEVSLLSKPEPLRFTDQADLLSQLRPEVDGVILECGVHRSTFLPQVWESLPEPRPLFGFGFGTDTNGLSAQAGPRGNVPESKRVKYPFTLFTGEPFGSMADFKNAGQFKPVIFNQPSERNAAGIGKTWSLDVDGSAHYGMLSDFVEELRQEGTATDMQDVFNAAERYLQTWESTLASQQGIKLAGNVVKEPTAKAILRPAPKPASPLPIPFTLPSP